MDAWWLRYPEALAAEKAGLDAMCISWKIDELQFSEGCLVIDIERDYNGKWQKLKAVYPDSFPYFLPQVFLDDVSFNRHQQPFIKNLCLLAREGEDWRPGQDTLAILLEEQFPKIQSVNTENKSLELVAEQEDHVAEPFSSFLLCAPNCVVIVPDETPSANVSAGRLELNIRPTSPELTNQISVGGVVRRISDLSNNTLVEFDALPPIFSQKQAGFWLRLDARPVLNGESDTDAVKDHFLEQIALKIPSFKRAIESAKSGQILLAGFVYDDEVSWRSNSDDWFFIAVRIRRASKGSRPAQYERHFVRADWGGEKAWMQRAPSLLPLRTKSALVIGLGSLGSPLCVHLARAGIRQLNVVDCDELQVGNTVRWALGWRYAGLHKASALTAYIEQEYPFTSVRPHGVRIGGIRQGAANLDYQLIRELCKDTDLIIDAAANHRVSHFLADLTQELGKTYLWLTTTHGAAGGVVGRIVPDETGGCWHCFQYGLADGSIKLPADTGANEIQPGGCSQPTFIGAGIDSDEIALLGARLAVATLSKNNANGYPDFLDNVFVADLNRDAQSIAPAWKSYKLLKNMACKVCNQ